MQRFLTIAALSFLLVFVAGCDKQKDDIVMPLTSEEFPQVIRFDDEGDGDIEDEDKFSFKLVLNDRVDPEGEELGGKIVPLENDVTVSFEVSDFEGFAKISDYILDGTAFYEVDDCTTSEDNGVDLKLVFDRNTGKGSVTFPKDVEEIEVEFEVSEDLFDDNKLNTNDRFIEFEITGVSGDNKLVTYNPDFSFTYEPLDDESISGEWALDPLDAAQFAAFKKLFSPINEDVANLKASEVEEILLSVEYNEVKVEVVLKETETVTECGDTDVENKVIEIEADLEELDLQTLDGEIELVGEIEQDDETLEEFVYKGEFKITGNKLELSLTGEYDGDETDEVTLVFSK
jgi:hypothetical protein